jgi:hypothetical protein
MTEMTSHAADSRVRPRNGLGTAALVTGPIAVTMVLSFTLFPLGGLVALVATGLGVVAVQRANRGEASNRNHAVAGLVCGVVAVVLAVVFTIRTGTFVFEHQDSMMGTVTCVEGATDDTALVACLRELIDEVEAEVEAS